MEKKEFEKQVKDCHGTMTGVSLCVGAVIFADDYATFEDNIELFYDGVYIARVPLKIIQEVY